jgi:DNA-binding transcriptional regulator YiaG
MASVHETAEGLHAAGILDKQIMREFDELCLAPPANLAPGCTDWQSVRRFFQPAPQRSNHA